MGAVYSDWLLIAHFTMGLSLLGFIGILFFLYKNPHKDFLHLISIFFFLLFSVELLPESFDPILFEVATAFISIGLIIIYFLRLRKRNPKTLLDYFKFISVCLLISVPLLYWSPFRNENNDLLLIVDFISVAMAALLLIYDRIILRADRKVLILLLMLQSLAVVGLMVYSIFQKLEADKQRIEAENQRTEAQKQTLKALKQEEAFIKAQEKQMKDSL